MFNSKFVYDNSDGVYILQTVYKSHNNLREIFLVIFVKYYLNLKQNFT